MRHRQLFVSRDSIQHSALGIQPVEGVAVMKNFRDLKVWEKAHLLTLWPDQPDSSSRGVDRCEYC